MSFSKHKCSNININDVSVVDTNTHPCKTYCMLSLETYEHFFKANVDWTMWDLRDLLRSSSHFSNFKKPVKEKMCSSLEMPHQNYFLSSFFLALIGENKENKSLVLTESALSNWNK